MEYQQWITKYKPYYLDDFEMDTKTIKVIQTLLEIEDLNMLIISNVCSGKTSLLYSILRQYYGLSKNETISENNIMFINNLKEQGINYFRNEMKTFCQSQCSIHGKKKIIVVDDIDTINEQSQQVFRNYIDKYKSNVHFLASCSQIQKVIESIQSRLHIINVNFDKEKQMNVLVSKFEKLEGIKINDEVREFLFKKVEGNVRKLISHLEKIAIYGDKNVDIGTCKKLCDTLSFSVFEQCIHLIKRGNLVEAIDLFFEINEYGYSVIDIYDYFYSFVKQTTILDEFEKYRIIPIMCKYITIFYNIHENNIELALFINELFSILYLRVDA
jgi:DNA polymerase III delta prime subunit